VRSHEIRERFLRFFEERGHHVLPNSSLIPQGDPSLLFTVAGMVPLKPYISGERTPPGPRLASCQRCFRGSGLSTDDISSVGDCTHHTLFEMLGNWSIGDYFKQGAIQLAWELLTGPFGLSPDRLRPSIYPEDAESLRVWTEVIGFPDGAVSRMADNWWQAGPTGPCGYDSEVYFDWGAPCSCGRADCVPEDECGGDRWMEFWNLVFMEWDQHEDGSRTALPSPTVDTGMGLERMACIMQGVRCNYETDLFLPIMSGFDRRAGAGGGAERRTRSLRVLSDHTRGAAFLIADGVLPSNEGRGYVLRRVIRRAAMHARRVELRGGIAAGIADVVAAMGEAYPDLERTRSLAEATIRGEEEIFARTVEAATARLDGLLDSGARTISGEDAFRLHDTHGLPVELTVEMAAERGIAVDLSGFEAALEEQRRRSREQGPRGGWTATTAGGGPAGAREEPIATRFVGYDILEAGAVVQRIGESAARSALEAGEEDWVFLDTSPFYAEAGGQVADTGRLRWAGGAARVLDCQALSRGRGHRARVEEGSLRPGDSVTGSVDRERRAAVARHHSATHLLHRALREVLGESAVQRGSYVSPDHATFDVSFPRALTAEELRAVERRVNAALRDNLVREVREMPVAEARASGAVALFGERYGDVVRVVDFGGWARELCGGTHVARSGDIGAVMIVSETSIGQGLRRLELVAGEAAQRRWEEDEAALREAARLLRARPSEVPERVARLLEQNRELQRRPGPAATDGLSAVVRAAETFSAAGVAVALADAPQLGPEDAAAAADRVYAERLQGRGVAAVFGATTVVVKAGADAVAAGVDAGRLARLAAETTGGRGGGQPGFARGGLKDPVRRGEAISMLRSALGAAPP
jgi:alanyl-tRNA synthetase